MPPELEQRAAVVRRLVRERCYAAAQSAFEDGCRALAETWAALPAGDSRRRQWGREWQALMEELRRRLLAARSHTALRLARVEDASRYTKLYDGGQPPPTSRAWLG